MPSSTWVVISVAVWVLGEIIITQFGWPGLYGGLLSQAFLLVVLSVSWICTPKRSAIDRCGVAMIEDVDEGDPKQSTGVHSKYKMDWD